MIAVELMVIDVDTPAEGDAGEELVHVGQGIDGDADPADLPLGQRMVGVVAHLGRAGRTRRSGR